jgi:hypothetical protein
MRIARSTGTVSGITIVLLGIWGGIVPFVGPYFNYSFAPNTSWHYTSNRLWLSVLPAVVTIIGGLMLAMAGDRASGMMGGFLALVGGAWFVIGPSVSRIWEHTSPGPIGAPFGGDVRQMAELVGYFYGVGALIIAFAAFAMGRFHSRPALARERPAAAPARTREEPMPVAAGTGEEPTAAPARTREEPMPAGAPTGEEPTEARPAGEELTDARPAGETEVGRRRWASGSRRRGLLRR